MSPVFPALSPAIKAARIELPLPDVHGRLVQPGDNSIEAGAIDGATPFASNQEPSPAPQPVYRRPQIPVQRAQTQQSPSHPHGRTVEDYLESLGFLAPPE
ncbi:hypothetical protein ACMAUO_12100 [Gluconacetobacter sp. Hr-1-5]|uniref:hypothetical protein n=1 Tax=Gluconacetobacter sp. Hr-1-5 TaxID=3395370 RepID=UPI003B52B27D